MLTLYLPSKSKSTEFMFIQKVFLYKCYNRRSMNTSATSMISPTCFDKTSRFLSFFTEK